MPAGELNVSLKSSTLWGYVNILKLSENMRVESQNDRSGEIFAQQLFYLLTRLAALHFLLDFVSSLKNNRAHTKGLIKCRLKSKSIFG